MTKMKQFRTISLFILSVISFGACNTLSDDPFEVEADVVFMREIVNGDTLSGIAGYVYANKSITNATLTLPNEAGIIELNASPTSSLTFLYEPTFDDFTSSIPEVGNYLVDVTGEDGIMAQIWDVQAFDNLDFAQIDTIAFDELSASLYIGWDTVSGADNYLIRLYDLAGVMVFNGPLIDESTTEYFLSYINTTGSWTTEPVSGETYTLSLQAFKYDPEATDYDFYYNIQEISRQDYSLVWEIN